MRRGYACTPGSDGGDLGARIAMEGFVFLERWWSSVPFEEVLAKIGRALIFGTGGAVHRLVPLAHATPNTYSGIYGLKEFPFHSDMAHWPEPPRYLMLRCLKGHSGVATFLVDGREVVSRAGENALVRALVKPRRPLNGTLPLLSLYRQELAHRASLFRWDEKFIVPASKAGEKGMVLVANLLSVMTKIAVTLVAPGDTLLIDNWRMLHGRSEVGSDCVDRIIERAYLGELF